jgi:hypothetical protein
VSHRRSNTPEPAERIPVRGTGVVTLAP